MELSEKGKIQLEVWKEENQLRKGPCDPEYKACLSDKTGDCKHLVSTLSLWCTNEDAQTYRGTSIPDIYNCAFHEARDKHIDRDLQINSSKLALFIFIVVIFVLGLIFQNIW